MFFDPDLLKSAHLVLSLVIQAIVLTFFGFFLGQWIDFYFTTQPYLQIIFAFVGFSIGIYQLAVRIKK